MTHNDRWIEDLAKKIRDNWHEWEAEADTQSQIEQDSQAGDFRLQALLVTAIEKAYARRLPETPKLPVHEIAQLPGRRCQKCQSLMMHTRLAGWQCPRGCHVGVES